MKTTRLCLILAISACAFSTAHAQTAGNEHGIPDAPTRLTNSPTTETGSMLKKELRWRSKIPLNKTYDQFTPEERAQFRALYESLPEGDEPPFPEAGMKPIFSKLKQGQHVLQARGELNLEVTVGPTGEAIEVKDFGGVTGANAYEMTNYAQSLLVMAKYKPATCKGKPCVMQFPFKLKLN